MKLTRRMCFWKTRLQEGLSVCMAAEGLQVTGGEPYAISHPFWVLDYCYDGGGLYKVSNRRGAWLERPPFHAHLYSPGTTYWENLNKVRVPFHSAFVCFWGGESAGLASLFERGRGGVIFRDEERRIGGLLQRLADLGQSGGEGTFWDAQAILCQIVGLLHQSEPGEGPRVIRSAPAARPSSDRLSVRVDDVLVRDLGRAIPLPELAQRLSVSVSALTHVYKRETGESVVRARNRLRMERARHFLSLGAPLKQIAEELGFCDVYHLSKTFKKVLGKSPRQYITAMTRS